MVSNRRNWTRDELLVAFNLYCRTPFGRLHQGNPVIKSLAEALGRTPAAVAMKLCNFASLDPAHQSRNVSGLRNAAQADRSIFEEFETDWESLALESEAALERLELAQFLASSDQLLEEFPASRGETEVLRSVRTRRVQSLFRATVLASYDNTCAISGISLPSLLQASHIIPWAVDDRRRLDPRNGIALSALHDRAFDRGLIAVDEDFRILLSGRLRIGCPPEFHRVGLLEIEGRRLRIPTRYAPDQAALAYHREQIFLP